MPSPLPDLGIVSDVAALWRANALSLAHDLVSLQISFATAQRRKNILERSGEVLEETQAFAKQDEPHTDDLKDGCAATVNQDAALALLAENANLEKQAAPTILEPDCPHVSSCPVCFIGQLSAPDKQASVLSNALEVALKEKMAAVAELKRALVAADTLCTQLGNLVRVLGCYDLKNLKKLLSNDDYQKDAKVANEKDEDFKMLQDANRTLVTYISSIINRVSAHQGFDKVLDQVLSGHYAKGATAKPESVIITSSSAKQPIDEFFLTQPSTTEELKPVNLDYAIVASSGESEAKYSVPAQATSSDFCLTPKEVAALRENLIGMTRPLVTELRPGIILKTGRGTVMYEARATEFIAKYTKVSVPQVLASFDFDGFPCIVMTKVPGTTLAHALESESPWLNVPLVCEQLRDALRQLRSVPLDIVLGPGASDRIAPVCDAWDPQAEMVLGGPRTNIPVSDLQGYKSLVETCLDWAPSERRLLSRMDPQVKTVLSHGDLATCNIMVGECGLTGIIDWENLGTYPPEWELECALSTCRFDIDQELSLRYIPPCSPCSQAPRSGKVCARRQGCHSADCVK